METIDEIIFWEKQLYIVQKYKLEILENTIIKHIKYLEGLYKNDF
jgi:hypothetical protein